MTFYTPEHLQQLKLDAKLHAVDFSRARIDRGHGDLFVVHLPKPMWPVSAMTDEKLPSIVECQSAPEAEGTVLSLLVKITRAERQVCRTGRVVGWTGDQIARRPLSDAEISEYKEQLKYIAERDRISEPLADALQRQKSQLATQAGVDHLAEQYGLASAKAITPVAAKADPTSEDHTMVSATRRSPTVRRGSKS